MGKAGVFLEREKMTWPTDDNIARQRRSYEDLTHTQNFIWCVGSLGKVGAAGTA